MHLLGTSVLMLVILPLTFSCEIGNSNNIAEDYRNVIEPQLKHVEAMIDQRNLNCTASVLRPPKNASSILRNICRANRQLKRIERQLQDVTSQPMPELSSLVQELGHSLKCWCKSKNKSSKLLHKWTLCKVKHILDTLQTYFEQYNASQSVNPDPSRRGKIK